MKASMARWDYRGDCGHVVERDFREVNFIAKCDGCDGEVRLFTRIWHAPRTNKPMEEHWNHSVNRPIASRREFSETLKRESERVSEYTGMEARFEQVDPGDTKTLKVTGEGLDATNRVRVNKGLLPFKDPV